MKQKFKYTHTLSNNNYKILIVLEIDLISGKFLTLNDNNVVYYSCLLYYLSVKVWGIYSKSTI